MKQPIILRIYKGSQLSEVKQFEADQIIFGQDGEVQVALKDPSVSAIHCLIELRDSGYYLCDLGSSSGTLKNGKPVLDEPISSGDNIEIGPFKIQFFVGIPKPKGPPSAAIAAETKLDIQAPPKAPSVPPAVPPSASNDLPEAAPRGGHKGKPSLPAADEITPPPVSVTKSSAVSPPAPSAPKLPETTKVTGSFSAPLKSSGSKKKSKKTYAPPSDVKDLKSYLKPTKGPVVEVLVAWKERVLNTYHFSTKQTVTLGSGKDATIPVPAAYIKGTIPFLDLTAEARVFAGFEMSVEVVNANEQTLRMDDLLRLGKAARGNNGNSIRLEQGELMSLTVGTGELQIFIRYVPATPKPLLAPPLDFTAGEMTGLVVSLMIVALTALYMSVYQPTKVEEVKEEEELRMATFVYNTTTTQPRPPEPTTTTQRVFEKPPATTLPPPTTQPKKVVVDLKDKPQVNKGNPKNPSTVKQVEAAKASEIRANPNNKRKTFGSVKQGGAVKTGSKEGSNADSFDPNSVGLAAAFGGGGMRQKLDKAYSGSGGIIGMANEATGASGSNQDRAGDDIGSRFRETGGGKGTATQGIAGIGTKGRGSGMSTYGSGVGLGGKGNVTIEAGGAEEGWEGSIDREAVRRAIRSITDQIKSCYTRQLRVQSGISGRVMIRFEIGEQGIVKMAKATQNALGDGGKVGACVATLIRGLKMPEPPQGVIAVVDFPFFFDKQQ